MARKHKTAANTATCWKCGRTDVYLRINGTLGRHVVPPIPGWGGPREKCSASGTKPKVATNGETQG